MIAPDDAVASPQLCLIQPRIGNRLQLLKIIVPRLLRAADPQRGTDAQSDALLNQNLFAVDTCADPLSNICRVLKRQAREHDTKLLATHAAAHVIGAQRTRNQPSGVRQHFIPCLMPEAVIDTLEMVQIDLDNRKRQGLLLALLWTQIVAFPFAIVFGRLAAKYDTGALIKVCIIAYTCINIFGIFLVSQWQFWVLATCVGMFQGGIQALSRSYLGKIIPAERSGEFYGLMDIFGKGASFVGLTLVSFVSQITAGMKVTVFGLQLQNENIAVASLIVLFIIGYILFCKADNLNKSR